MSEAPDRTKDSVGGRTRTKDGVLVEIGQVWRDLDPRQNGRTVRVIAIYPDSGKALVQGARMTTLSIKRMHRHSTGWELFR